MQVVSTKHRYMKVCIIAPSVVHVQKITNAFNEWLLQDMNAFVYPSLINTDKIYHYSGHQRTLELSKPVSGLLKNAQRHH
jgi:hypothetical protein